MVEMVGRRRSPACCLQHIAAATAAGQTRPPPQSRRATAAQPSRAVLTGAASAAHLGELLVRRRLLHLPEQRLLQRLRQLGRRVDQALVDQQGGGRGRPGLRFVAGAWQ